MGAVGPAACAGGCPDSLLHVVSQCVPVVPCC